jgi:flagellar basal-body rod protein FlgG
MNQGIYSLSATMINQLDRVDVLSNNIANSNTNGFKEDHLVEGSFNYYLSKSQEDKTDTTKMEVVHNTIPKIDGDYIKGDIGTLEQTGDPLDFAIKENEMFFKTSDNNGNIKLTRDGSFNNVNGFLTAQDGSKVLDYNDQPIPVTDGFKDQIALVRTPFTNLTKVGNNNYTIDNQKAVEDLTTNKDYVLQGTVEKSNVNAISSMVSLIDAQRRLEQSQKAITSIDDINGKLITQLGNR